MMNYTIENRDTLPHEGDIYDFQGFQYQERKQDPCKRSDSNDRRFY